METINIINLLTTVKLKNLQIKYFPEKTFPCGSFSGQRPCGAINIFIPTVNRKANFSFFLFGQ
jgi:hypothetical protein